MDARERYETSYVKAGRFGRRPRLVVTWHDEDGCRHEKSRAAEPGRMPALRREAEEWRAELNRRWLEELAEEERRREEESTPVLADAIRDYISDKVMEGLEASTAYNYSRLARLVSEDGSPLAGARVGDVTPERCRRWLRWLVGERGIGAVRAKGALALLKAVLDRAEVDGVIERNQIARVRGPRVERTEPNALDRPSVARLRAWVEEDSDWLRTAVAIALYTGMRRGEVCALRWGDVDLDAGSISLTRALGDSGHGWYLKAPKSGRSRTVPVPPALASILRRRLERAVSDMAPVVDEGPAREMLRDRYVCGRADGSFKTPAELTAGWLRVRDAIGVRGLRRERCTFHDLRHTYITYMVMGGVPVAMVSAIVGHASAAMTLDVYTSVDPEAVMGAASAVEAVMPDADEADGEPTYELPPADD